MTDRVMTRETTEGVTFMRDRQCSLREIGNRPSKFKIVNLRQSEGYWDFGNEINGSRTEN